MQHRSVEAPWRQVGTRARSRVLVWGLIAWVSTGCGKGLDGPTPKIDSPAGLPVDPGIICRDQLTTAGTIHGEKLSPVPIDVPKDPRVAIPTVTLVRSKALDGTASDGSIVTYSGDPDDPTNVSLLAWKSQREMSFTVNQAVSVQGAEGMLATGVYDVRVKNPNRKGDQEIGALAVVDKPAITKLTPNVVCLAQGARELSLSGTTFLELQNMRPTLSIDGASSPFPVSSLDGCTRIAHAGLTASYCTDAKVSLGKDSVGVGFHAVSLTNPETAACHSVESVGLLVVPPPAIDSVTPKVACSLDGMQTIAIEGSGFLEIDGQKPTVMLGGKAIAVTQLSSCDPLQADGTSVKSCKTIELAIDTMAFPLGDVAINVTNPEPAGCSGSASAVFRISGPPKISSVAPSEICNGEPAEISISGTGFDAAAQVVVDGVMATSVNVTSDTQLVAVLPEGLPPGPHSVTVTNVGSCTDTQAAALKVDPAPIVFFADPPVIYSGVPVAVTVFTSGLISNASKVELVAADGTRTNIASFTSPERPNKILANLPAGLTAGPYNLRVTNGAGCAGVLRDGFQVTDKVSLGLASIDPEYVDTAVTTAVTLTTDDPLASGEVGFAATPRVYLSKQGGGTATALKAVSFKDAKQISAIIPKNTPAGDYDVVVVNPTGEVGVLASGLHVKSVPPPLVTNVVPSTIENSKPATLKITGDHFTNGATVALDCRDQLGTRTTRAASSATVGSSTQISADFAATGQAAGSVCLVKVQNPDGAWFAYSAISVKLSSANLSAWTQATGHEMQEGRRALALVAGRPTFKSRYLYAIGGDSGTTAGAKSSVEAVSVGVFGDLGTWALQSNNPLPGKRTLAGSAVIGRFVYLTGGHDGTSATNSLYRAQILDPLEVPAINDLDADLGDGTKGLGAGVWYYRVAATYAAANASNPSGESLPSEPFPVQLPNQPSKIVLTVKWDGVPGANGYRVYRSPSANSQSLELLATLSCPTAAPCECGTGAGKLECKIVDDATKTTQAGATPLPEGSLGKWHALDNMTSKREGHATVAVQRPNHPDEWFLYAFGGRNQNGGYLDTYEWAKIQIAGDGSQSVATAWTAETKKIGVAKADLAAWVVTNGDTSVIASTDSYVFVGTGRTGVMATTGEILSGAITDASTAGTLTSAAAGSLDAENGLTGFGQAASGYADAGGYLYVFGGESKNGGLITTDSSGLVSAGPTLPTSYDSLGGGSIKVERAFPGTAQESAFFFIAGGRTSADAATKSVEQTVQ